MHVCVQACNVCGMQCVCVWGGGGGGVGLGGLCWHNFGHNRMQKHRSIILA